MIIRTILILWFFYVIDTLAFSIPTITHEKVVALENSAGHHPFQTSRNSFMASGQSFLSTQLLFHTISLSFQNLEYIKDIKFEDDEVLRLIDPNTVKLKSRGLVSLAGVQTPSGYNDDFRFPACMSRSPASKVKQYLSPGSKVKVKVVANAKTNDGRPRCLIVSNGKLVNAELVREGFARTSNRGRDEIEKIIPGFYDNLNSLQKMAQTEGMGMYTRCESVDVPDDDQFEQLDFVVETRYQDDGGTQVLRRARDSQGLPPPDPTPVSKAQKLPICADFDTYEDALSWFERYFPYYGDVAKLDRDGDGVPCSGLPHTTDQNRYRMKKPQNQVSL